MKIALLIDGFASDKVNGVNISIGTDILHQINLDDEKLNLAPSVLLGSIKSRYDDYDPIRKITIVTLTIERFKKASGKSTNLDDLIKLYCFEKEK